MLLWILIIAYVVLGVIVNVFAFKQFNVILSDNKFVQFLGEASKWLFWLFWIFFWIGFAVYMHFRMSKIAKMHRPKEA